MAEYKIIWSDAALKDTQAVLEYIVERDSVAAALNIYEKIITKVDALSFQPERCRVVPELKTIGIGDFRELIVKPYRICFRIYGNEIVLVSVLDGRRDLEQILFDRALYR